MLFDLAAWAVILVVVLAIGGGVLARLDADTIRPGDRFILATWIGIIVLASMLLAVSLIMPLTPLVSAGVATTLSALGIAVVVRSGSGRIRLDRRTVVPIWSLVSGASALLLGAAAFASDPVTLYDSLVYHVGLIHWLREQGTVPGVALIHNRLGHVSSWFTLAAALEWGPGSRRSANVPLGFTMIVVGVQAAIAVTRIAARSARRADWFLLVALVALIWAACAYGAATPSPDVATNVLIVMAAWSMLVTSSITDAEATADRTRLLPVVLALGACAMKLFAFPALVAAMVYYLAAPARGAATEVYVRRGVVASVACLVILGPLLTANLVASGCPAYPSPIGCLDASWSVGSAQAADYAHYVRDVARWERRGTTSVGAAFGWIVPWIIAHPVVASLAVLSPAIGVHVLRRTRDASDRYAANGMIMLATLGIVFAAWEAPAPRFLFAFVLVVPALAVSVVASQRAPRDAIAATVARRRASVAFLCACVAIGFAYALASQKLNVRSAVASGARLVRLTDLTLPARPEEPRRLFRWRVNDVDVYTPVPRPVADTLGYESVIAHDAGFEKCSTASLPCTPYLPQPNVRLRRPGAGLRAGFAHVAETSLGSRVADCVVEIEPARAAMAPLGMDGPPEPRDRCPSR